MGGIGLGKKKDPDRHPSISKSTPEELAGRGQESYKQLFWPPRDRKRPPSWCVKQNKGTKVPYWLTFWGAHRMASSQNGELLLSNPSTNEELKHIVPIRKEMQIWESGICVHDNRGNVFWQIWVHLYSNKYFSLWLWHFFAWDISEPYWMLLSC